ncbi:virulence RhuM family protein [Emticicia fluvialis]|uniref:virulence RhuM family protein n=1 Tax=Emticicia fluvialis TaxID=2974474 RepID=UPI0021661140|nr:virulence RhuM family protein [Emticicia fluvialis]
MENIQENFSDFLFYTSTKGNIKIQVIVGNETVWLSQKNMAEIFNVEVPTINYHLKEIYKSEELDQQSTIRKILIVQNEGSRNVKREIEFYNLDAIISVGYRVNSQEATQFRIWATSILKEFLIKGFTINDERLKQGQSYFESDYFEELLERIREIRASERRFYQKITDIYAQCSIDYNSNAETTKNFYATVQNKLEWAIIGKTASEIIIERASASKPYMGLTSWKNESRGGKILKSDVTIAKNYLSEEEIKELNRIVNMYLDYAELQASRKKPMKMKDWIERLDSFLSFNEYEVLKDSGKVSHEMAKSFAEEEYSKFRIVQDQNFVSDFDKHLLKQIGKLKKED